jgi:hypothetical protein
LNIKRLLFSEITLASPQREAGRSAD